MSKVKIIFLGTPLFVKLIKDTLAKHFTLVKSLKEADLAVVAAYGRILTKDELDIPQYGFLNIHPSLLPKYRGPSPIQQAILNGDKVSGITIIKMDEDVDHGPIIYQEKLELSDNDNFDTLSKKMFQLAAQVSPKIIEDFVSGRIQPTPQNHDQATYCVRLTRESGYFPIDNPLSAEKLDRMIRAYHPWPGVWTVWEIKNQKSKIKKIVKFLPDGRIQMEGKKAMPMRDFLNGYPDFPLKEL
ncbi:methionyl-tRNA formyltransferase [Candidatus Daviesbacteria bacterium]|nr:methionyl-tRNA formyltransferase [Candidatus Daviesbacteria bacterium]